MKKQKKITVKYFIKKYNSYLQMICLLFTLIIGVILNILDVLEKQEIIIDLLCLVSVEIIIGNLYQCIEYDLKNMIAIEMEEGYIKFDKLLSEVKTDLFISGITCNSIWKYTEEIEEILKKNLKIRILTSSEDAIDDNIRIICDNISNDASEINKDEARRKLTATLDIVYTNVIIQEAYNDGRFQIRKTDVPFTLSFIGINLFGNKNKKILKITQNVAYHEIRKCPSMILHYSDNKKLFKYYFRSLEKLWEKAVPHEVRGEYEKFPVNEKPNPPAMLGRIG